MKMTMTDGTVFEGSLAEYTELLTLAKALDAKVEADVATIKGEQTAPVTPQVILAKEGDEVTINFAQWSEHGTLLDLTEGKRYKVVNLPDGLNIFDDKGEERNLFVANPSVVSVVTTPVIPQVADVVTFEGFDGEYRKVERKAQAGDFVVFRENEYSGLSNGVPYLVKQGKTSLNVRQHTLLYQPNYGRTPETVDVFEKVEAQYVPQEGDYITVTGNRKIRGCCEHFAKVGAVLKVSQRQKDRVITNSGAIMDELYRKATPAEVEAYEKAVADASKPKLKAGDFVKITESRPWVDTSKIYEVIEKGGRLRVVDENGYANPWAIDKGYYELATDEEVKWAQIGRKEHEGKVGDIVRVVNPCGSPIKVGRLLELDYNAKLTSVSIDGWLVTTELIAPVESTLK